ncbi:hypothetical protein O6H91_11G107100 [Diphasiastrum complanatum]|uniref:Uncharacterized protein n=1 Tax=Diphasiastrum complanatum TaxID=34168 RepID=A0ACC2CCP1_DIPCM|nr:hypothetical protein O6H91_11G107100 [Diphasiastrum complanatum]
MGKSGYKSNYCGLEHDGCVIDTPQISKMHQRHPKADHVLQTKRCLTYTDDVIPTCSSLGQVAENALSDSFGGACESPRKKNKALEYHTRAHDQNPGVATLSNTAAGVFASVLQSTGSDIEYIRKAKIRGNYKCSKCGQPKKGHVCIDTPGKISSESRKDTIAESPRSRASESVQDDGLLPEKMVLGDAEELDKRYGGLTTAIVPHTPQPTSTSGLNAVENSQMFIGLSYTTTKKQEIWRSNASMAKELTPFSGLSSPPNCFFNEYHGSTGEAFNPLDRHGNTFEENNSGEGCQSIGIPDTCLLQIMARLPPTALLVAGHVCRQWQQCAERTWAAVREAHLILSVPTLGSTNKNEEIYRLTPSPRTYIPFILQKCSNLVHLMISVLSQLDDTFLKSIASSRPELSSLEINMIGNGINTMTGEGLEFLASTCKLLSCLKIEGCQVLSRCHIVNSEIKTMWLSGCQKLTNMVLESPLLMELSLDFVTGMNANLDHSTNCPDSLSDLTGQLAKKLQNVQKLHLASPLLDDRAVFNLLSARFRCLRMLSLIYGVGITDESAIVIASNCSDLELLDLSGSSITDKALVSISTAFSKSLRRLLVAVCPKISEVGLQEAVAHLPLLELLDCGRALGDGQMDNMSLPQKGQNHRVARLVTVDNGQGKIRKTKSCPIQTGKKPFRALVLQHSRLEKISFWGCSNLQSLVLDCPNLIDLNLNDCQNLRSDDLVLRCPYLRQIHALNCEQSIVQRARNQIKISIFSKDSQVPMLWHLDGSKRVHAPISSTFLDAKRKQKGTEGSSAAVCCPEN